MAHVNPRQFLGQHLQTGQCIVSRDVIERTSDDANRGFVPFTGAERPRPLVKSYSLRIVGDLQRVVCALASTAACRIAIGYAGTQGFLTVGESAALVRALPVFLVVMLLLLFPRRGTRDGGQPERAMTDVVAPAALAWLIAVGATTNDLLTDPLFLARILVLLMLIATCSAIADGLCRLAIGSPLIWPRLARNVAIYGMSSETTARVYREIEKSYGLRFAGLFENRTLDRIPPPITPIDGDLEELLDLISRGKIDEVVITLPLVARERIAGITKRLQQFPVDVHLCTHVADDAPILIGRAPVVTSIGAASMTRVQSRPMRDWDSIVKALEDRLIAGLLLIVLSPLFLLIGSAIRLDSAGPVFFRQRRHGVCGQTIVVWKFRTMRVMENGPVVQQATKGDPRVTRVGRWLRASSLDELPQLLNVINGEMSLVGPRPHAVAHDEYYGGLIETYVGRHQVKPGITGWAQINGLRGETEDPALMAKRVEYDIWYIQNWSLTLDLKILVLTPMFGLVHKNAY